MKSTRGIVCLALLLLLFPGAPLLCGRIRAQSQAESSATQGAGAAKAPAQPVKAPAGPLTANTAATQQPQQEAPKAASAGPNGTFRLERRSQLVLIPALVTDRAGRPIHGLKAGDFVVKDNGKVRPVRVVEEITAPPAEELELAKLPPGTYSNNVVQAKAPLRIVIILFDMLNSHFKDQVPAREQLTNYLNGEVEPGTMVALLGLGRGGLRMYHDLTSDTKGLATELQMAMATGRHSISTNLQNEMSETESEEAFVGHGVFAPTHSSGRASRKVIVLDTLDAFKDIAGAYSSLPGRKSLIWVTGGFPFTLDESKAGSHGMEALDKDTLEDILPDYQSAWQALNDANIALYPVDMHGLQNTSQPDASYRSRRGGDPTRQLGKFGSEKQDRNEDNLQTFQVFAGETGGKAFYNDNDMVAGFREAVNDSHSSYLLGYYLEDNAAPGWHKLHVECTCSGAHIRARAGFLVPRGDAAAAGKLTAAAGRDAPEAGKDADAGQESEVQMAMASPMNYTGLPITVKWLNEREAKPVNGVAAATAKRMVTFQIILPPNAAAIDPEQSRISLNFVGLARTPQGDDAADFVKQIDGVLKPDVARRLALAGIKFDSAMLLAPGYYNVRFVVRDNVGGHLGSVTAPVVVK